MDIVIIKEISNVSFPFIKLLKYHNRQKFTKIIDINERKFYYVDLT